MQDGQSFICGIEIGKFQRALSGLPLESTPRQLCITHSPRCPTAHGGTCDCAPTMALRPARRGRRPKKRKPRRPAERQVAPGPRETKARTGGTAR